jgi:hypothetical protein
MRLTKRIGIITASALVSAGALFAAGAAPAKAATPVFCNGHYLCAEEVGQSISTMYIDMWAATYSFEGHFQLQTPEHTSASSRNQRNYPGDGNAVTFTVPVVYGNYCATAWKWNGGSSYTKLGYLCFVAGA